MSLVRGQIDALRSGLSAGEFSADELFAACRAEAERWEARLGAFRSLESAPSGTPYEGPLSGIPYAIKENIALRGHTLACGSRILEGYRPPYDATVSVRLREAGAVLLGQTNMDEFGMGSSTENSAYGVTRNPWDPTRTPGGSSGGSAAAVAAGVVPFALGTDTGGSIRQPAAFCGIVGLKPSYGRVSRYGLVAYASSLDQIGPLANSVRDVAHVFAALAGHDPCDATSLEDPVEDPLAGLERSANGLRIGVPRALLESDGLAPEIRADIERLLGELQAEGASLVDIELPMLDHAIASYYILATAEASSNLARFDGVRYGARVAGGDLDEMYCRTRSQGFGDEVKLRILLGSYVLSAGYHDAYYRKAAQVRTLMRREFDRAWEQCDVIALPTAPTTAFELGERRDDPLQMYLSDVYTVPANLTGVPAIAVPTGLDAQGLPLSVQLMAPSLNEATLLRAARAVERLRDFASQHRPPAPEDA